VSDRIDAASRQRAISTLRATTAQRPLDVLVVGGGVVGCGAALDAVSRGLTVGLVERRDLASGTSSRSSRLAHGGLRYLEQREFSLVHEALTERGLLVDRISPHLVRPVPFLFPVTHKGWQRRYVGAGIALYDMLSRIGAYGGTMPRPRSLSKDEVGAIAPGLSQDVIVGAVSFHDAQMDDARHTIALARSAVERSAHVATQVEVVGLERDDAQRVVGARVRDCAAGDEFVVHARVVVGAAGVWSDHLRKMAGSTQSEVRQSKGVHLVVPRAAFNSSSAVIARTPASVLFMLPWAAHWLIGTTDTDDDADLDEPVVTQADVEYLVDQTNRWVSKPISPADVVGVYAGLRPLLRSADVSDTDSTTVSREHAVLNPAEGFVCVVGGKWTTYRVMARDVIDGAVRQLQNQDAQRLIPPSLTADIPVVGAAGFRELWDQREDLSAEHEVDLTLIEHLLHRHGDRTAVVLDLIAQDSTLGQRLHAEAPYVRAEVVVAVTDEGAQSIEDVLVRRMRLALEVPDGGRAIALATAGLMAPWLDWSESEVEQALNEFASSHRAKVPLAD